MGTLNTTLKQFIGTGTENTDFRAVVQLIHDFFGTTCGLTQAADSGQIVPSTTTFPGSNNSLAGEEIWYFTDLSGGFRISYGRGASGNDWRIQLSVSMSVTNGSRVFLAQESATNVKNFATAGTRTVSDTTLYKVIGSGSGDRFIISFFPNVATSPNGSLIAVEKTRAIDASSTNQGIRAYLVNFGESGNNSTFLDHINLCTYQPTWKSTNNGIGVPHYVFGGNNQSLGTTVRALSDTNSSLSEGKMVAWPFNSVISGARFPLLNLLVCSSGDFPLDFTPVVFSLYGTTYTYMPLGVNSIFARIASAIIFQ